MQTVDTTDGQREWPGMSAAAEQLVAACTHPLVIDVARDLLEAIARLIPEGQTLTPPIGNRGLATEARVHRRTVCRRLPLLVEINLVRLVDGGNGRPARFTLVPLAAPLPATNVALPLRADLQQVPRRPQPRRDTVTADLFDDNPPPVRSMSEGRGFLARILATVTGVTGWPITGVTGVTGGRSNDEKPVTPVILVRSNDEKPVPPVIGTCDTGLPLDVAGTRARAVLLLKERTTTTAPPADGLPAPTPLAVPERPCRWFGKSHAWCHDRMHVPTDFHLEERAKLPRQPGQTDADLDEVMFAKYAAVMAAIPATADLRRYKNQFDFWKEHLRLAASSSAPATPRDPYAEQVPPRRQWHA